MRVSRAHCCTNKPMETVQGCGESSREDRSQISTAGPGFPRLRMDNMTMSGGMLRIPSQIHVESAGKSQSERAEEGVLEQREVHFLLVNRWRYITQVCEGSVDSAP